MFTPHNFVVALGLQHTNKATFPFFPKMTLTVTATLIITIFTKADLKLIRNQLYK